MDAVQMNVRIGRELKASGDGVFADIGFDGMTVSDWGAMHDRPASLKAGLDLEMPGDTAVCRRRILDGVARGVERRLAEAEAWLEDFQKPIRDCYAELGIDFDSLPPLTADEYRQLEDEMYDDKYAAWLGLA